MWKALLTLIVMVPALALAAPPSGETPALRHEAVSRAPAVVTAAPAAVSCTAAACPSALAGSIELPVDGATVSGYVRLVGFALNGNQMSQIDVYVDGMDEANRVTSPGGVKLSLPRPDIMQAFPSYLGTAADHPGFEASFKASSYSDGAHVVYIRVTDVTGCCYFLPSRAILIDNTINQPPFGDLDYPLESSAANPSGVLPVVGWALDASHVDHIDIYVDGLIERQAFTGIPRPDIFAAYPDDPDAIASGFILNVDSTRLANGVHEISAKAVDD
ncbi:MAG: hypothetical protein ACM3JH_13730, partial [Acidithiobacillales bacterium]